MRHRETTVKDTLTGDHLFTFGRPSAPSVYRGWEGEVEHKEIFDVETSQFTRKLECGEFLPINPVVIRTSRMLLETVTPADMHSHTGTVWEERGAILAQLIRGDVRPPGLFKPALPPGLTEGELPPDPRDALRDLVVNISRQNALSERWDILTSLAEARATMETIRFLSMGFWKKTRYVAELAALRFKQRKDRRYAVRDAIEWFSENWLLARYGIRPILFDLQSATSYLNQLISEPDPWVAGRSRQEDSTTSTRFEENQDARIRSQWRYEVESQCTYRAKAYVGAQTGWSRGLMIDPLVTTWELIPFSFIFDWVVDVGGWLSTLTPNVRGEFLATSTSYKRTYSARLTYTRDPIPAVMEGQGGVAVWKYEEEYYMREPYDGIPPPRLNLRFDLPKFVDLLTLAKRGRSDVFKLLNRR